MWCWVFVSMRGLSLVAASRAPLFIALCGPLTVAASLVAEHRLQMRRLSSCGSRAQLLRGMWDLPRPGLEPTSPALAGRLSTTPPPGKPLNGLLKISILFRLKRTLYHWDFPGGPVVKTPCSQCRGPRLIPLVRELEPTCRN